jgi:hypothetical protein
MKAKPDLVPDCDVHGEPMYRDECAASVLGLEGSRDVIVWRCCHQGCGRYFHGTAGYRNCPPAADNGILTPRCAREGAFLIVQRTLGSYICPVAGCTKTEPWQAPVLALPTMAQTKLGGGRRKSHESCYGQVFPTMATIAHDREAKGKVFGYRVEQPGVIPSGFALTADANAWDECTSCPEFEGCYRFSVAKLVMELAARN